MAAVQRTTHASLGFEALDYPSDRDLPGPPRGLLRDARESAVPTRALRERSREYRTPPPASRSIRKSRKKSKTRRRVYPKRNWTAEEDALLRSLIKAQTGPFNWSDIARHFHNRVGKQCRERWHNHLSESVLKTEWTLEEDDRLVRLHGLHGNSWAFLTQYFPGRTDNMIKNRWNTTLSRRVGAAKSGVDSPADVFKDSEPYPDTAAELAPPALVFSLPLSSLPGTITSLEDHRTDKIPNGASSGRFQHLPLSSDSLEPAAPTHYQLTLSHPQFTLRIPVFDRAFADLHSRLWRK